MQNSKYLIILSVLLLSSCAAFLKKRTFIDEMDRTSEGLFVPGQDFNVTPGDRSDSAYRSREEILKRTPASFEREQLENSKSLNHELVMKERNLNQEEYEQYAHVSPYLESTSEKIYFLSLSSEEKRDYVDSMRLEEYHERVGRDGRSLASLDLIKRRDRDIQVGMTKDDVRRQWGPAFRIDVAGDPIRENERWSFQQNGRMRYVFFEQGVVQGWSLE